MKHKHEHHTVRWVSHSGLMYKLFCVDCRKYLNYETQNPPTLSAVKFPEAMGRPSDIAVTLEVHDSMHINRGGL